MKAIDEKIWISIDSYNVFLCKKTAIVCLFLLLLGVFLSLTFFDSKLSGWGDNASFIILGKAIAAGEGMVDLQLPDTPPHTKFPWGFPLLLSFADIAFPDNIQAMKGLVSISYILSIPVLYPLLKYKIDSFYALIITVLYAFNPTILLFSSMVMSEIPYLFFSIVALFLITKSEEDDKIFSNYFFLLAIIISMYSFYIRTVGISLVIAISVYFIINGKKRQALSYVALVLFLYLIVSFFTHRPVEKSAYVGQFFAVDPYNPALGQLDFKGFLYRLKMNLTTYTFSIIPAPLDHRVVGLNIVSYVIPFLVLLGLIRESFKKNIVAIYFLFFFSILLAWPDRWAVIRMVVPLIPFLMFFVASGVLSIYYLTRFFFKVPHLIPIVIFLAVCAIEMPYYIAASIKQSRAIDAPLRNYYRASEWIRDNSPEDSIVICRKPSLTYVKSGRATLAIPMRIDSDSYILLTEKHKNLYVIVDSLALPGTREYLVPSIDALSLRKRVAVVHIVDDPKTMVLQIN